MENEVKKMESSRVCQCSSRLIFHHLSVWSISRWPEHCAELDFFAGKEFPEQEFKDSHLAMKKNKTELTMWGAQTFVVPPFFVCL